MRARAITGTLLLILLALSANFTYAQAPQGFSYQAVIRNSAGAVITNQNVSLRFSITNPGGTVHYSETQTSITTANGIVNLTIGAGTVISGTFATIPWSTGDLRLKVEVDVSGGTTYTMMGTTKLYSVPFALYAASGTQGPQGIPGPQGNIGPAGENGISIYWLGSSATAPGTPSVNQAYYNTTAKKAYVWDGDSWEMMTQDGAQGVAGPKGETGSAGTSVQWMGSLNSSPSNPTLNQCYYNITDKKAYIYDGAGWSILTVDGAKGDKGDQGTSGPSGLSLQWLGNLNVQPSSPTVNQAYYNTTDKKAFVYDGSSWTILAADGAQGAKGDKGDAGTGLANKGSWLSTASYISGDYVFDRSTSDPLINSMWICQTPVGPSAIQPYQNSVNWAEFHAPAGPEGPIGPQGIQGNTGPQGAQGSQGIQGVQGDIGQQGLQGNTGPQGISVIWAGSSDTPPSPALNKAYYNTISKKSYIYDGNSWSIMTQDGSTGAIGATGLSGTSIQWAGTLTSHPTAVINKAYYNSTDKKSYIYNGVNWMVMTNDGVNGATGSPGLNGISIQWLGSLANAPGSPTLNQAYYNTTNKISYVYSGSTWNILAQDGTMGPQGPQGTPGTGLTNKGNWTSGNPYANGDYVFNRSSSSASINSMWICQVAVSSSTVQPYSDLTHWVEFQAPAGPTGPQGPAGPLVTGSAGQTLAHNGTTWIATNAVTVNGQNVGIGTLTPQTRLVVQSESTAQVDDPIFEVRNKDNKVVLGVYNEGVRVYVADAPTAKGARGGFAVGGLTNQNKAAERVYMRITPDSARIYVKDTIQTKGARGGFAVGGLTNQNKGITNRYLYVHRDSTRIYINDSPAKGARGGFAVGGLTNQNKGSKTNFLNVTKDSTRIFTADSLKGFGVGSRTNGKFENYLKLTPRNYFIGHESGKANISGEYNSFLGYQTGVINTSGSSNSLIGYQAGNKNTTGSSNVFIGYKTGYSNQTGTNNVAVGNLAGYLGATGANNVFFGDSAGYGNTNNYNVFLGKGSGKANTGQYNTFMGYHAGLKNTDGVNNVFIGTQTGRNNTIGDYNTFLGYQAGYSSNSSYNLFIGYQAGRSNTNGQYNSFMGYYAGLSNSIGSSNVFIGHESGKSNINGGANVFIGQESGKNSISGTSNIFIGLQAGLNATSTTRNTFIGFQAGNKTNSDYNTLIGCQTGSDLRVAPGNTFIGYHAGVTTDNGSWNVCVGMRAGGATDDAGQNELGNNNVYLGAEAGHKHQGNNNVLIGSQAGGQVINSATPINGDGNIFIGYKAGWSELGSNKLYIDNSGTATPLIYGDFTDGSEKLVFNGNVGIGTTITRSKLSFGPYFINATTPTSSEQTSHIRLYDDGSSTQYGLGVSINALNIAANQNTGTIRLYTNSLERLRVDANGNVGIGTTNPSSKLDVNGMLRVTGYQVPTSGAGVEISYLSNVGYIETYDRTAGASRPLAFAATEVYPYYAVNLGNSTKKWNAVYALNGTIQTSDSRLKKDIVSLDYGLESILKLKPVSFLWKDDMSPNKHLGLIAQDVLDVMKEVVDIGTDPDKTLGINYSQIVPVLIKGMQEQQQQIESTKQENQMLKAELQTLKEQMEQIKVLLKK